MGIFQPKLKPADMGILYRQLAIMLGSGVPVSEAIEILAAESESRSVTKMAVSISKDLKGGKGLSETLSQYPEVFNAFVLSLLNHADNPEKVSAALHELAEATEDASIIRTRFLQALYIPIIELVIGFLILAFISLFVIPIFEDMFSSMGSDLPLPTLVVVRAGGWIGQHLFYLIVAFIIVIVFFLKSRKAASMLLSFVPGLNRLAKQLSLIHFTRHLRMLLALDIPLNKAVDRAASTVRHTQHARRLSDAAAKATGAVQLDAALASTGLFAKSILHMIRYGTRTENLSQVVEKIAGFYRMEFNRHMAKVFPRIQICGTLIVGVIMGFLVTALYLPIFKMAGSIY